MGKHNRRALILNLFAITVFLTSCMRPAEGSVKDIPVEGKITYSGDVTEIYRDNTWDRCQLNGQEVNLKGEYRFDGARYVEISRKVKNLGDCDPNAYKLLIDEMSLRMNQPIFTPGQKK